MRTLILIAWRRISSFGNTALCLHDWMELLHKPWVDSEWIVAGVVLLWIPMLRVACLLFDQFRFSVKYALPVKHTRFILWSVYWLTVLAAVINLLEKFLSEGEVLKVLALAVAYVFILLMDFKETHEVAKKIEQVNS